MCSAFIIYPGGYYIEFGFKNLVKMQSFIIHTNPTEKSISQKIMGVGNRGFGAGEILLVF